MDRRSVLGIVLVVLACGASLPRPRTGPHPANAEYVEVSSPPPAAQVEVVPPAPDGSAVWVDGEWAWRTGRWVHVPGGWVRPPDGGYLAPWTTVRISDGRLMLRPSAWYDGGGRRIASPPILVLAGATLGAASGADGGP
jgi:hypothetical protein